MGTKLTESAPGLRLTAADRPGVAQPVPERDLPTRELGVILQSVVVLAALAVGAWEWHWRTVGVKPSYRNSDGAWAEQRRRINEGEGDALVLIGASRTLFNINLDVWQATTGRRPIQLALEGTSPIPILEDLANDPEFTGSLFIGVTPRAFFWGTATRAKVLPYFHTQSPSQRSGHWLSKHLLEPYLAFYDPDFALVTVLNRQAWPLRAGVPSIPAVRRIRVSGPDRNTWMWEKVEQDAAYQATTRNTWLQNHSQRRPPDPIARQKLVDAQIAKAKAAIAKLRARGVSMVFVRHPSAGELLQLEEQDFPRAQTWNLLLSETAAPGLHFEDVPAMQGYWLPEQSHLSRADSEKFTAKLAPMVEAILDKQTF